MGDKIEELERRYQRLLNDFRAGNIDEATFISQVDRLQFVDDWGRYWMLGSESGAWHYYDGTAWHLADPRERDKLPFMDDQGRYWQKGAKSNDWYYYQPETNEWVKPGKDELTGPASRQSGEWQSGPGRAASQPAYEVGRSQDVTTDPVSHEQFDDQLFQDDDGRYWIVGAKSGQWYFYDENGWHPAHEFKFGPTSQPPLTQSYQPQTPYYAPSSQQSQSSYYPQYQAMSPEQPYPGPSHLPHYPQPPSGSQQPPPGYETAPPQNVPTGSEQPTSAPVAQPASTEEPAITESPRPPQGTSPSGTWYYHDGQQWLKYSTGEPADGSPPDPMKIVEPGGQAATINVEEKSESIVAEFFDEDGPPIEVVDVEVITVIEAEPDPAPESRVRPTPEPSDDSTSPLPAPAVDEVRPRRSKLSVEEISPGQPEPPSEAEAQPRRRTAADTGQPIKPRKRTTPHEPTIIIPAGTTRSGVSSPSSTRTRMATRPIQPERRGVSQDPAMEAASPEARLESRSGRSRHQQVTQPLPIVRKVSAPDSEAARRARQPTREDLVSSPTSVKQPPEQTQLQKRRPTFGDVLRSLPDTVWNWVAGVAVLLIAALIIILAAVYFVGDFFGVSSVASGQSPTPTLDVGLAPDATPTPGPTPTFVPEPIATPAPISVIPFSSPGLGFSLDYPEVWYREEDTNLVIFSPSTGGLDPTKWADTSMRIGMPADNDSSISELLTAALATFPLDSEKLNEGTISIASQMWTSTQIKFDDEDLGGQGISTIAVTSKDGVGHYLIAVAPAEEWNAVQPIFQDIIDSFRFIEEDQIAQVTPGPLPSSVEATDTTASDQLPLTSTPTPEPTAVSESGLDPVVYVVQSGDTLLAIAARYGVDVVLLASENGVTDPESLRVDQELTIPFTEPQLIEYYQSGGVSSAVADESDSSAEEGSESVAEDTAEVVPPEEAAGSAEAQAPQDEDEAEPPAGEAAPLTGRIIYPAYNPGTSTYDLWIADVAAGEQSGFMGNASQPAFNRDGSLLAYRSWDLGTRGVFFQDFIGGRGGKVTNFVEDGLPVWSPDGFTFAFSSRKEGDRVPRLYIGNQLGEETIGLSFQGEYPAVLPDGRLVAKGCTPSGNCGLFLMGPRGGGETKISDDPADTAPSPSPDGSKIAFMSIGRGATNWEIWVMNVDGTNPRRLTENGNNDGLPTWSPDGQSIAYVSDQGGVWGIWVMNADGSNQRKLFDMKGSPDGKVLRDESNSRGWLEERISWAP